MHNRYIFSNILGTFVFNEHFKIINQKSFRNSEEYSNHKKYEKELAQKYKNIKKPGSEELTRVLSNFKDKKFFKEFHSRNLELTKKAIKASVTQDMLLVQAVNTIKGLDKTINTLVKNLREWYGQYNPEFSERVKDNKKFVELILKKPKRISAMGSDLAQVDITPMIELAKSIDELYILREKQEAYIKSSMEKICPNLNAVAGHLIGAKLIEIAGSLKKLAMFPASTVQLLGAEEALFRHLKTGAKPPRHGIIVQHPLISEASQKNHGKIARNLADKISIAVKVDYFKGKFIGDKLRKELDKKFKRK